MSEAHQSATENPSTSATIDEICDLFRRGLETAAKVVMPPESACKHFREARIEMLRGFREIIDQRIDHLSRRNDTGTRVTVE